MFGGGAKMQSRSGLRLEGEWLVWVGRACTFEGGAKMQSRRGLRLEWLIWVGGLPCLEAGMECRVGVACVWRGSG